MTPDLQALARRAVACRVWRWLPGMRAISGWRVLFALPGFSGCASDDPQTEYDLVPTPWPLPHDAIPDLTDPATLGCMLSLVREAWKDSAVVCLPIDWGPAGTMWQCQRTAGGARLTMRHYATEAESLVAALEAAAFSCSAGSGRGV